MIRNFFYRVAQYVHENRARSIKALAVAVLAMAAFLVIRYGVEELQKARYEKRVRALDARLREKEAEAEAAQARADAKEKEIQAKEVEARQLALRAAAAESALRETRRAIAPLKETYEQTRRDPEPVADMSCADACTEIQRLTGYSCSQ